MIDETLTRLIREAGQALDAIESPEHMAEMEKLTSLDNERVALAEAVQGRVIAYTNAQEAIFKYRNAATTAAQSPVEEPAPEPETPADDPSESTVDVEQFFCPVSEYGDIRTPHTNGLAAYTED